MPEDERFRAHFLKYQPLDATAGPGGARRTYLLGAS
jgi:hypothetical protein